jgi:N-acetyl-anhydromuramyl-L-alanine amidase AmpD
MPIKSVRRLGVSLLVFAASGGCLMDGSGDEMASEASLPPGLQLLPGVRNDALRAASERFNVPVETLAVIAYQKGRFEMIAPSSTHAAPTVAPTTQDQAMSEPPPAGTDVMPAPPPDTGDMGTTADDIAALDVPDNTNLPPEPNPATVEPQERADAHMHVEVYGVAHLNAAEVAMGSHLAGVTDEQVRTDLTAGIHALAGIVSVYAKESGEDDPTSPAAFEIAAERLLGAGQDEDAKNQVRADLAHLLQVGFDVTTEDGERIQLVGVSMDETAAAQAALSPGAYPPVQWIYSPNFSSRQGNPVRYVVIHDMEGFQSTAIQIFKNPAAQASAHYLLRSSDGHIVQMVHEGDNAWHCGNGWYNENSIGIEHEGFADRVNGGGYYTAKQYQSSAQLVCAIAKKYRIPVDHRHIFGHGNVPVSGSGPICSDAQANAAVCGGFAHHHDPGRYWNWSMYLTLISNCVKGQTPLPPVMQRGGNHAVMNADGRLEVFARGTDNALWRNYQTTPGGTWSGWKSLGGQITWEPAAVVSPGGRVQVFARGTNKALYTIWQNVPGDDTNWSGWGGLGGQIDSSPRVVINHKTNQPEVFALGTNYSLYHLWRKTDGSWSGWAGLGGILSSDIEINYNSEDNLEIFALGTNHSMYHMWQGNDLKWSGWAGLGGTFASAPTTAKMPTGGIEVFGLGTNHSLYHAWYAGGKWSSWEGLGGTLSEAPTAYVWPNGHTEVFGRGTNNAMYHLWNGGPGTAWGKWAGFDSATVTGNFTVITDGANNPEVFTRGQGGDVVRKVWDPTKNWGGLTTLGGKVASF